MGLSDRPERPKRSPEEETLRRVLAFVEAQAQATDPGSAWWDLLLMIRERMK